MKQPLKPLPGYTYAQKIGNDIYSGVYKCIKNTTKEAFAAKIYNKCEYMDTINPKTEIGIVRKLDHPNIIKCVDVFVEQNNKEQIYAAVFKFYPSLQEYIDRHREQNNKISQAQAKTFIQQILSALLHVHQHKIVHRDITLGNILLHENEQIKLSGFALSQQYGQTDTFQTYCGTPITMAPQILDKKIYSSKCDTWSFGVICYQLLFCTYPFTSKSLSQLLQNIKSQKYLDFLKSPEISEDAKEFLKACLTIDQEQRPSIQELKNFKWFQNSKFDNFGPKSFSSDKETIIGSTSQNKIIQKQNTEITNRSKLGHTTFSSDWQTILGSIPQEAIRNKFWEIECSYAWLQIFSKMISTECQFLETIPRKQTHSSTIQFDLNSQALLQKPFESIQSGQRIQFLRRIIHVSFPCLLILFLQDLDLLNIEPLTFLDTQKLKEIDLAGNKIISIKSLNKQKWNSLDNLNFNRNKMRQIDIHRTKFSQNFGYLNLDHFCHNNFGRIKNEIQVQDISKVVKFEPIKLKRFILSEVRTYLDQPVIIKKLKDRFPKIDLLTPDRFMFWS